MVVLRAAEPPAVAWGAFTRHRPSPGDGRRAAPPWLLRRSSTSKGSTCTAGSHVTAAWPSRFPTMSLTGMTGATFAWRHGPRPSTAATGGVERLSPGVTSPYLTVPVTDPWSSRTGHRRCRRRARCHSVSAFVTALDPVSGERVAFSGPKAMRFRSVGTLDRLVHRVVSRFRRFGHAADHPAFRVGVGVVYSIT